MYKVLFLIGLFLIFLAFILKYFESVPDNVHYENGEKIKIVETKVYSQDCNGYRELEYHWDENKFKLLKEEAEKGDIEAQTELGILYLRDNFVRLDINKAKYWLEKAANRDNAIAQHYLGYLYSIQGNVAESIKWHKLSADKGNSYAQIDLALILGDQPEYDINEIVSWLEKAISNGNEMAYFPLAYWYLNEETLNKESRGLELLIAAANNANPDALYLLAELYETGDLVPKDLEKSRALYLEAKQNGSKEAEIKLENKDQSIK